MNVSTADALERFIEGLRKYAQLNPEKVVCIAIFVDADPGTAAPGTEISIMTSMPSSVAKFILESAFQTIEVGAYGSITITVGKPESIQ